MPKYVYVQLNGVEKPARIRADKIERQTETKGDSVQDKFVLIKDNAPVGEFAPKAIVGWWIQDEGHD